MTRIAGMGDLHIGAGHLTSIDDQRRALDHVCEVVEERHIELVLLAGDTTHHARPTPEVLDLIGSFFGRLERAGAEVVIVAGNHDPQVPAVVQHFRGRVHVALTPTVFHLDGVDVAAFPWLPDKNVRADNGGTLSKEEVAAQLTFAARSIISGFRAQRRPGVPMVLVGHATVAGSTTPTGFSMGFVPGTHWVIPVEDLAEFDVAFVGHVHKRQAFGNTIVPGSLLPLDFSETEEKGITVIDLLPSLAEPEIEFVRIRTPAIVNMIGEGVGFAKHLANLGVNPQHIEHEILPGALVRVRMNVDEATAREYPPARIERALLDAGARKVQVELDVVREDRARDAEMTTELLPLTALGRYLDGRSDLDDPARTAILGAGTAVVADVAAVERTSRGGDIELEAIEAQDFLSHTQTRISFDGEPIRILAGPNGAGKSSIGVDALRHSLYGTSRVGARPDARLIRQGADRASTAVELRLAGGRRIRVVRKLKRERGDRVATTLDILEATGDGWIPLSTGKLESGQAVLDELLGGLDDATLIASSIVVQRQANSFTRARPEERKALLARAAGLGVYDELGLHTARRLNGSEKDLARLEAQAEPLRVRAAATERLEAERADAELERGMAAADVTRLEREHVDATEAIERARERADTYTKAFDEAAAVQACIEQLDRATSLQTARTDDGLAAWSKKASVARAMVADKAALLAAREQLEAKRGELAAARTALDVAQAGLDAAQAAAAAHAKAEALELRMQREIDQLKAQRDREAAAAGAEIRTRERQAEQLRASGCLERCAHDKNCTVRREATDNDGAIGKLADRVRELQAPDADEIRLAKQRDAIEFPPETPDTRARGLDAAVARGGVDRIEKEIVALEKQTQVAEKIAAAEQVLKEHDEAVGRILLEAADQAKAIEAERAPLRKKRGELNALLLSFGASPAGERDRAAAEQERIARELDVARIAARHAGERVALLDGRLEEIRAAAGELVQVEEGIHAAAAQVAAWKELISAWRDCRVMALETSLIPQIETIANDVLHRFPHGLQIALRTQRAKKSGDGVSEVLDIDVLGGKGPSYELCSGGEMTTIDFATHVALAVVVSRRASTRLHALICDEPEGLDEPSRTAFAAVVRWLVEEFSLRCLLMSHNEDLVEALGGEVVRLDQVSGPAESELMEVSA